MTAYAALDSLRRKLRETLDLPQQQFNRNGASLQPIHAQINFLVGFFRNSCVHNASQISALERKTIDATYKAENFIQSGSLQPSVLRSFSPDTLMISLCFILYIAILCLTRLGEARSSTIQGHLSELVLCTILAVALYLHFKAYYLISVNDSQELQGILYDFNIIVQDAVQIQHPDHPELSPHAALRLLRRNLDSFLRFGLHEAHCKSLRRNAATASAVLAHRCESETKGLPQVVDEFSNIVRNIEDVRRNPSDLPAASSSRQDLGGTSRNVVVGLGSDLEGIKTRLTQDTKKRQVTSIVGMGSIEKTTLARQVYNDPYIPLHFDIRAWVTVSQEYSLRQVLLCLLEFAGMLKQELQEDKEDELAVHLYKILTCRRYLIVMDDVWGTEIWDFMSTYFPDNQNGSRVLLTSRLSNVASYPDSSSPLHRMQCLNEDKSWDLLREIVFGAQTCPLELESIGREVAGSCRGLPLAIVVIGGLLYNDNRIETWRNIVESLQDCQEQYLEILGLSYNHLPYYLRPCFLYIGAFQRDREIPVSTLISLWVAEGFLSPGISENMEELGVNYLKDLIDRNLISVCKKICNGKIRTCSIHDRLRDVCVQKARKEKFLQVVESGGSVISRESPDETPRRLSIHRPS